MNYEQKYKQALERAKHYTWYSTNRNDTAEPIKNTVEAIFPELKESEDERMMNAIIASIKNNKTLVSMNGYTKKDMIDYLEKQKERLADNSKKSASEDEKIRKGLIKGLSAMRDIHKHQTFSDDAINIDDAIAWLEKQGEQKPTDKVEYNLTPKARFKKGDWIVHDMSDGRKVIRQIVNMTNKSYVLDGEDFNTFYFNDLENDYHLWTIQDAKDGDVLAINNEVFIYAHRKQLYSIAVAHCFVNSAGGFYLDGEFGYVEYGETISPATKEQRDFFFQKMKEAGYEWDAEKKELKIEQTIWSEEDERTYNEILDFFLGDIETRCVTIDKQRHFGYWLKSLNPNHWKPSEYDISLLEEIARNIRNDVRPFCSEVSSLEDLIKNLKTL